MLNLEKIEYLESLTPDQRRLLLKDDFEGFIAHYFGHYIQYPLAPFHYEMLKDLRDLLDGKIKELAWIMFREAGKTSYALMFLVYCLCYELDEYINVDSYDAVNAKRILFDAVLELQINKRIVEDFGEIYNIKRSEEEITQKSIGDFITNPVYDKDGNRVRGGIRVEGHSTGHPVRGRRHGSMRPGILILDDFENEKTIKSDVVTQSIASHIQSFKGGLDTTRGRVLYLANYLSEFANVQSLIERSKVDHELRIRIVPIMDDFGNPTWPEKYAKSDDEAKAEGRVSIEGLRRRMWTPERQDMDFMAEMMCRPIDYSHSEFKKEWFDNRYFTQELEGRRVNTFITFDNAPSQQEYSDFIGCNVVSISEDNTWYSRYVKRYKLNTPDLIDEMFRLHALYKPIMIGVEQKAFEGLIKPFIDIKAKELNRSIVVEELKDMGRNKEDKIRGALQGRFKTGMIKLQKYATDDTQYLVQEAAQFPNGKYDDLLDSLAMVADIAYPPRKEERKVGGTPADVVNRDIKNAYRRVSKAETPDVV